MAQATEAVFRLLRHRLYLQREDTQLIHHPRHAVGDHTKIFRTDKHACGLCQSRQFLHGLLIPELVVAVIEVVVVETVEISLLLFRQPLVCRLVLHGYTRMPAVIAFMVNKEQVVQMSIDAI